MGSVDEFMTWFEELRSLMLLENRTLTDRYFLSSFMARLKESIRSLVYAARPNTLLKAMRLARLNENIVQALLKKGQPYRSSYNSGK